MNPGRFQINPGPLRIVPSSRRRPFAEESDFADLGRCEALLKDGSGRCTRNAADGGTLCWQHAQLRGAA